jgi:low temperature requirement protein LtrA
MSATARTPHLNLDEHHKVSWLELFYDLVYGATVVQLGNKLSEDMAGVSHEIEV